MSRLLIRTLTAFILWVPLSWGVSYANKGTQVVSVANTATIRLPEGWEVLGEEVRIKESLDAKSKLGINVPAMNLIAISEERPAKIALRLHLMPSNPKDTQAKLLSDYRSNPSLFAAQVRAEFERDLGPQREALRKLGAGTFETPKIELASIGGYSAISISHERPSQSHGGKIVQVTQYHIPNGKYKAVVVTTVLKGDRGAEKQIADVLETLSLRAGGI